jgi:cob(I)alamin adenosyltransferase
MLNKGLVYVFTGDGKGKTSAALGVALRSLLLKNKVIWVSWYKTKDWNISEMKLSEIFTKDLEMYWAGKGFYINGSSSAKVNKAMVFDYDTTEGHKLAAHDAVDLVLRILTEANQGKKAISLIILDEINQTIKDGLLKIEDIKKIINSRGSVNLVLTGREFPQTLINEVDLITEMKKIKHPYDSGVMAIKGLDF